MRDRGRRHHPGQSDSLERSRIFDLGILIGSNAGHLPASASKKAVDAYGDSVWRDMKWVVEHLHARPSELTSAAEDLRMDPELAREAVRAVAQLESDGSGGLI